MQRLVKIDEILCSKGCKLYKQEENFERFQRSYSVSSPLILDKSQVVEVVIPSTTGTITLTCKETIADFIVECSSSDQDSIEVFCDNIPRNADIISVTISKNHSSHSLNIISSESFSKFLIDTSAEYSLTTISRLLKLDESLEIIVEGQRVSHNIKEGAHKPKRSDVLRIRQENCSFENASNIDLIPDDFAELDIRNKDLEKLFKSFRNALAAIFLLNYSKVISNDLLGTLCGFKKKEHQRLTFSGFSELDNLYKIYEWVYSNKTYVESIELARNLMSLQFLDNNVYKYNDDTLTSIRSNYRLIARQCTKDYLETKHQIESQINMTIKELRTISSTYQSQMFSLMLILLTLLFTVIITGFFGTANRTIFDNDFIAVFSLFWIIFLVSFTFRTIEEKTATHKLKDEYGEFLKGYEHLIDGKEYFRYISRGDSIKFRFFTGNRWIWIILQMIMLIFIIILFCVSSTHSPVIPVSPLSFPNPSPILPLSHPYPPIVKT